MWIVAALALAALVLIVLAVAVAAAVARWANAPFPADMWLREQIGKRH